MSVTSQYTFLNGFFNSVFFVFNTQKPADQAFSESSSSNGLILTVNRPNNEILIDLGPQIATNETTGLVANQLVSAGASLTSKIRVQGVPWVLVPYFLQKPLAHNFFDMLVRVDFDFHIETPWYCSDADGTISVYLFLFIDKNKHLQGSVDGAWFSFNGGGPFCAGKIQDGLSAALPAVISQVKPVLAKAISQASGVPFKTLYYLPGNGIKTPGIFIQDASADLALALIPALG